MTPAPIIETKRLILRGPAREDLAAYTHFMTTSPRLKAMGELQTASDAWFGFLTGIGHWQWHGFGFFTLTTHDDPTPLGRVGLLRHLEWQDVETAWHLFEGHEGNGYATEAAIAVRSWARDTLKIDQLVSYIHTANTRSQSVARRLGASTDSTRGAHEPDAEIWVHPTEAA